MLLRIPPINSKKIQNYIKPNFVARSLILVIVITVIGYQFYHVFFIFLRERWGKYGIKSCKSVVPLVVVFFLNFWLYFIIFRCQYAHGESEKRPVPRHPKYKTAYCQSYHQLGYCPYGPRCHFIHSENSKLGQSRRSVGTDLKYCFICNIFWMTYLLNNSV